MLCSSLQLSHRSQWTSFVPVSSVLIFSRVTVSIEELDVESFENNLQGSVDFILASRMDSGRTKSEASRE